jgi:predicted metal-dependent HD superfamily phosphohydrolase
VLETDFLQSFQSVQLAPAAAGSCWSEIVHQYAYKSRHYHSLHHLESVWEELQPVKTQIQDWPVMVCAIAYHDFYYDARHSDNEEKSAGKAISKMMEAGFGEERASRCYHHIMATKGHQLSADPDTNLFTDADLSILGQDEATYRNYLSAIRKEYRVYPDFLYKPGRRKVLRHFLGLPRIFKTEYFFQRYEVAARENIGRELEMI